MRLDRKKIVEASLWVMREMVQRHALGELPLFDRHRDLLRDVFEELISVPKEMWGRNAQQAATTGLGAIAEGEESSFLSAMSNIVLAIALGVLNSGGYIEPKQLSLMVQRETAGLSEKLRQDTEELWLTGLAQWSVKAAQPKGQALERYLVYEGPRSRSASDADVAELWAKLDSFTLFIDESKEGWFYKAPSGMQPIPWQPGSLEWHFLCLALQRVGGYWKRDELRAAFAERIGKPYDSELWQLRQRLNEGTGGVVGSIVKGQPKGGGYRIAPAKTCLIQKMLS